MKLKLQQLKNDLHNRLSNQQLATFGGVLCIGALAYAAYKYMAPTKNGKTPNPALAEQKSFQQTYRQVIMNVQQCINKHQALNGQVIKCILKNQYKLAQYEFKSFIFKVRNQRRKLMRDKHEYRRVIMTVDAANQELMDKNLNAILAHFNIEKTNWIQTVEMWSSDTEQNKEEWQNLLIDLDNELLDSLRDKSRGPLSFKKLNDIFNFKIHTLQHMNESELDLESSMTSDEEPDLNAKYTLIEKYIQDLVFNKFGVEEEDIVYSENQLSKDDQDKIFTIDDEFTELMRVVIYGDEEQEEENEYNDDNQEEGEHEHESRGDQDNEALKQEDAIGDIGDEEPAQNPQQEQKIESTAQQQNQEEEEQDEDQYF